MRGVRRGRDRISSIRAGGYRRVPEGTGGYRRVPEELVHEGTEGYGILKGLSGRGRGFERNGCTPH